MSCLHIVGQRRDIPDSAPFKFLSPGRTKQRMDGLRAKAASEDPSVRSAAASSPLIDEPTAWHLSRDPAGEVRGWLARNPHIPLPILFKLSKDHSPAVRAHVAWNTSTPQPLVLGLALDEDANVRIVAQTVLDNT